MQLNKAYNKDDFKDFLSGFLPDDLSLSEKELVIGDNYKNIKSGLVLGESKSLGVKVFYLEHEKEKDARVALTTEAFKILSENWAKKALVVFNSKNSENWRLSLMTISFDINEKNKIVSNLSNPKRKSFFLGPNAKIATANQFLLSKGKINNFEDLESRFDVEVVTKEFFNNYKKLYIKLLDYLKNDKAFNVFVIKHGLELEIFGKKLLGQIIFIYFLQKKGWLGAKKGDNISNGDKIFLRNLFEKCKQEKKNFFNDYLESLFYDCLNRIPERAGSFYREKFDCQIPFLNGGLFEPVNDYKWKNEFINIPNDIFSNNENSGILDVFDLYNFTIDENTPDDQEISVDPEMLGKVFENLLESNTRKGQGAFYTPREIVHYMCRESLVNYLATNHSNLSEGKIRDYINYGDSLSKSIEELGKNWKGELWTPGQFNELNELLRNIKVVDPACGSGAFLVGMLQEIVRLRTFLQLTPDSESFSSFKNSIKELSAYDLKKETIQNCLYGVDIDPGAIDIAKLRFWLSIVVEENIEDIEPLPNLDYKIMQGNSLLEDLAIGDSIIKFDFSGDKKLDKRTRDQRQLFSLGGIQGKLILDQSDNLIDKLEKLHTEFFIISDSDKKKLLKKKIDQIEDYLIQSKCQEEIENAENTIKNNPIDKNKILKNTNKILAVRGVLNEWNKNHLRPFFPWRLHFGEVFKRENGGFDVVIGNPPYGETIKDNKELFKKIYRSSEGKFEIYKFFIEKGIYLISKSGVLCLITPDTWFTLGYFKKLRELVVKDNQLYRLTESLYGVFDSATVDTAICMIKKIGNGTKKTILVGSDLKPKGYVNIENSENKFVIYPKIKPALINKIESGSIILDEFCEIWQGLIAYSSKKQKRIYSSDKKETDFHKKLLYGSSIGKYITKWKGEYLKYGKWLHRPRPEYIFNSEKILVQRIRNPKLCQRIIATFDNEKYINGTGLSNIILRDEFKNEVSLLYILALINSKLLNYWFSYYFTDVNIKPEQLRKIPVKQIDMSKQILFANFVEKILEITRSGDCINNSEKQAKIKEYDKQIDQMVYELYDLTEEEIKIVEKK